jgi:formate dehydrogenase iron-sulfur subunit
MVGILVDVTKCTGCEECVAACGSANGIAPDAAASDRATARDGLSANRLCTVLPLDGGRYMRKACMHCLEPSCVSACLVGGLTKTPGGPVVYDSAKCIGCRYCMLACPFHIPRYEWGKTSPFMKKCHLCFERLSQGKRPACVEACPHEALSFGDRDALLRKGLDLVREYPGRYLPKVWGQSAWGGTSVLYVSDVDLAAAGWPAEATVSIPSITDPMIRKTPFIGITVGLTLWAVSAVIGRRQKLMSRPEEPEEPQSREESRD